jgi:hypothetical protein
MSRRRCVNDITKCNTLYVQGTTDCIGRFTTQKLLNGIITVLRLFKEKKLPTQKSVFKGSTVPCGRVYITKTSSYISTRKYEYNGDTRLEDQ